MTEFVNGPITTFVKEQIAKCESGLAKMAKTGKSSYWSIQNSYLLDAYKYILKWIEQNGHTDK